MSRFAPPAGEAGRGAIAVADDDTGQREVIAFLLGTAAAEQSPTRPLKPVLRITPPASPACFLWTSACRAAWTGSRCCGSSTAWATRAGAVMAGHGDILFVARAAREGGADFTEKPIDEAALLGAVGGALATAEADSARSRRRGEAKARLDTLSPRECEVLDGLLDGEADKDMVHGLGVSARTVELHRVNMVGKHGLPSVSEAVRLAFAAGLQPG